MVETSQDLRETVRRRYAEAARAVADQGAGCPGEQAPARLGARETFAYGVGTTEGVLDLAPADAAGAGVTDVELLGGTLEQRPLPGAGVGLTHPVVR